MATPMARPAPVQMAPARPAPPPAPVVNNYLNQQARRSDQLLQMQYQLQQQQAQREAEQRARTMTPTNRDLLQPWNSNMGGSQQDYNNFLTGMLQLDPNVLKMYQSGQTLNRGDAAVQQALARSPNLQMMFDPAQRSKMYSDYLRSQAEQKAAMAQKPPAPPAAVPQPKPVLQPPAPVPQPGLNPQPMPVPQPRLIITPFPGPMPMPVPPVAGPVAPTPMMPVQGQLPPGLTPKITPPTPGRPV